MSHTPTNEICEKCHVWSAGEDGFYVLLCPLHAAAPDLLAAAKQAAHYLERGTNYDGLMEAIAHAEGKEP